MNRDQIEAWRDYIVRELNEGYGITTREAQRIVARRLRPRSLGRRSTSDEQPVPEVVRIRRRRATSSRGLHSRLSAHEIRAARA
jgi:hypothetical protein